MRTNCFRHPAYHSVSERRLCRFDEAGHFRAHETVRSYGAMEKNDDLKKAREQFDNSYTRAEYPEINDTHPVDRAYFRALLLDSVIGASDKSYEKIRREDLNVADPLELAKLPDHQQRGRWLAEHMPLDLLRGLDDTLQHVSNKADITEDDQFSRLGQLYMDRVHRGEQSWKTRGNLDDSLLTRVPLERYRSVRQEVDAILDENGIRVLHMETDPRAMSNAGLTRPEYLTLLSLVWKGGITVEDIRKASSSRIVGVRDLIGQQGASANSTLRRFVDLSLEELGPNETLSGLNIVITPEMRTAYMQAVSGEVAESAEEGIENSVSEQAATLPPDHSAATWEQHPERAFLFLSQHMDEAQGGNAQFIQSLGYHFVLSPEEREGVDPPLTEENTRAILTLISQSLLESQKVIRDTVKQKNELRESLTLAENVEKTFGNVWEYMKDIRSHPVGSMLVWAVAIIAARKAWKFLKGEHSRFTQFFVGIGIAGGALGLYQQHTSGRAWWEGVGEKMNEWMGRENIKEPLERTLPNHWTERLDRKSDRERVIISIIGDQQIGPAMEWYGNMHQWEAGGKKGAQPPSPFKVDSKLSRYFGARATSKERNAMIYETMSAFFADRGRAIKKETPEYATGMPVNDDAAIGYAYIKDRYLEQKFFTPALRGIVIVGDVEIDGSMITEWDPENPKLREIYEQRPDIFRALQIIRQDYLQESSRRPSADWDMNQIFLFEANAEILRRMGRDGVEAAGMLDRIADGVTEMQEGVQAVGGNLLEQWRDMDVTTLRQMWEAAGVRIEGAVDYADNALRECVAATLPVLREFPGELVKVTADAGSYVLEWLDRAGVAIGTIAYDQYVDIQKAVYEAHGVPDAKFEEYSMKEQLIESHIHDGRNAGLRVSVIGTDKVMIGQFDGNDGPHLEKSVSEFLTATTSDLIHEWIENAVLAKNESLGESTDPPLTVKIGTNPETVEYDYTSVFEPRATSSVFEFMQKSDADIASAFADWVSDTGKSATDIDPLNRE